MVPDGSGLETADHKAPRETRLTVDELADLVGMSRRTIRAHQARKLLPPPVRAGRVAYYDENHIRRLENIKSLQRQGFNLVAIQAMLGSRQPAADTDEHNELLRRLCTRRPQVAYALVRHGLVARAEGGGLRVVRQRVFRSAFELRGNGMNAGQIVEGLIEILDQVRSMADELVHTASERFVNLPLLPEQAGASSTADYDEQAIMVSQGIAALLVEVFRIAVERSSQNVSLELISRTAGVDMRLAESVGVDNG